MPERSAGQVTRVTGMAYLTKGMDCRVRGMVYLTRVMTMARTRNARPYWTRMRVSWRRLRGR